MKGRVFAAAAFGEAVRAVRDEEGMSLRPAADGIGIGHNTLHRIERGQDATTESVARAARWAGLRLDRYVRGE